MKNKVPGTQLIDRYAMQLEAERDKPYLERRWSLEGDQLSRLEERCHIPHGQDAITEGLYSWSEAWDDCDNCSSWAIKVLRHILGNPQSVQRRCAAQEGRGQRQS